MLFKFWCYFQTIFPNPVLSDIWRKCFGVTNPSGLTLFSSFSLVYLSLSANGCGLLKGVIEGSAWNFYPNEVHGHWEALSHALCPAWIKHTHIHSDTLPLHGHLIGLINVLILNCLNLFYEVCFLVWALMSFSLSFLPTLPV